MIVSLEGFRKDYTRDTFTTCDGAESWGFGSTVQGFGGKFLGVVFSGFDGCSFRLHGLGWLRA